MFNSLIVYSINSTWLKSCYEVETSILLSGKRIGKATGEAGEISGRVTAFLSEIFKASRMIRIYQKEKIEQNKLYFRVLENIKRDNMW